MNAAEIALAGSLLVNVLLLWKLIDAQYRASLLRSDVDYWRDSALHWSKSFEVDKMMWMSIQKLRHPALLTSCGTSEISKTWGELRSPSRL